MLFYAGCAFLAHGNKESRAFLAHDMEAHAFLAHDMEAHAHRVRMLRMLLAHRARYGEFVTILT